jgi:lauroyl/myristoyl acyltransferase
VTAALQQFATDSALTIRVAAAWVVSGVLPERYWPHLTRTIASAAIWLRPEWRRSQLARLQPSHGDGDLAERRRILAERIAFGHESRLYGLREYWPGSREHRISVVGSEIVRESLTDAKGAILWIAPFVFGSIVTKIGLHRAGHAVHHLSRPTHGFGPSRWATRRLNPIWTRIEDRFLRERIVMFQGTQTSALRTLRARLAENQVVSITVGDEGVHTVTVSLLGGDLRLATGPISLAEATGAPLIPVFTVCTAPGEFVVEIQSPLELSTGSDREARFVHVGEQYARRLAPYVMRHPGQWLD